MPGSGRDTLAEALRPRRGGLLRPFGCRWFIREFLLGHGPNGSLEENQPKVKIAKHYATKANAIGGTEANANGQRWPSGYRTEGLGTVFSAQNWGQS